MAFSFPVLRERERGGGGGGLFRGMSNIAYKHT